MRNLPRSRESTRFTRAAVVFMLFVLSARTSGGATSGSATSTWPASATIASHLWHYAGAARENVTRHRR